MKRALSRSQLLAQVERILLASPSPISKAQLAERCGVHRSTMGRLEQDLLDSGVALRYDDAGHWYVDYQRSIHNIKLTNNEILALYLAARLLSRHSDEHNPHAVSALEKLADALRIRSPIAARHIMQAAAAVAMRKVDAKYIHVLEELTRAWTQGRQVRFLYHSYQKNEITERRVAPYFFEPVGAGYACYVIGYDYEKNDMRTFKLKRILEVGLLGEEYTIPETFNPQQQLASAWGVIWRDQLDYEVVLRFSPTVVKRVKESVWHPSQQLEDQPDGSCRFTVRVGSTMEIKPWVRGWGADVEVLAPAAFREEIISEVRAMAQTYGLVAEGGAA